MNECVDENDDKWVHKGDNHPDIHDFDVGRLRHWVKDWDEEGGQGHQCGRIYCNNTWKHINTV